MRQAARLTVMMALIGTPALPIAAETIRVQGVFAAGAREASLLPTIGVDLFEGPDGDALGNAIERRLTGPGMADAPHADIIAPALRPDGLLTGRAAASVDDFDYIESRERCVEKKDKTCVRREKYRVRCTRRTVTLNADLKMIRTRDGRIVYAMPKRRSSTDNACEDSGFLSPVDGTVQSMIEGMAQEVRLDLAPHFERYTIRIKEDRKALPADLAGQFRAAIHDTKHDAPTACARFAAIGVGAPDHGPTLFNRALCAESAGQYREAFDLYTRARVFAPDAGSDVSKGLSRVAALVAGAEDSAQITTRAAQMARR